MDKPKYPAPDRSDFAPNQHRKDPDMPEGDIGSMQAMLAGARPYVVESWYSEGTTFITIFFSILDIESASPQALVKLVMPVLIEQGVPEKWQSLSAQEVHRIKDAKGNEVYSLTFVVGEPKM